MDLSWIGGADSITGWTVANVLKRTSVEQSQVERVRKWAIDFANNETVL